MRFSLSNDVEALLDLLEAARLGLDPLGVGAQLGAQLARLEREAAGALGQLVQRRVHPLLGAERRLGLRDGLRGASVPAVPGDGRERLGRGAAQGLGVAQARALGLQLGLLGRIGRGRLDLGQLEAQEVEVALASALALAQLRQLAPDRADLGVGLAVEAAALQVLGAGEAVEGLELGRGEGQPAVLVLAVEGEQPRAERAQLGGRRRAALQEGARAPRRRDAAADDELGRALGQARGHLRQLGVFQQALRQLEDSLDVSLLGPRPDDLGARLAAHDQVE